MAIFLSDKTAYDYWFGDWSISCAPRPLMTVPAYRDATATGWTVPYDRLLEIGIEPSKEEPLHLAVPEARMLCRTNRIKTHLLSDPPPGSFVRLSEDVFVESPVLALMRSLPGRSDGAVLKDLYRLLGSFCVHEGKTRERVPLATAGDLHRYLMGAKGRRGVRRLVKMLPYVLEGAASVRECEIAVLLFAPPEIGGQGLPLPVLNHRIEPREASLKKVRYADYCWVLQRLILEYDSNEFHTGAWKLGQDSARRAQLQREGFEVVTMTDYQLVRKAEFEDVVGALRAALGNEGWTGGVEGFAELEAGLRRDVLGFDWLG